MDQPAQPPYLKDWGGVGVKGERKLQIATCHQPCKAEQDGMEELCATLTGHLGDESQKILSHFRALPGGMEPLSKYNAECKCCGLQGERVLEEGKSDLSVRRDR